MKEWFIFLAVGIPSPKHPKKNINMFFGSLMEELKELWQGVDAYDIHLKCRLNLHATYMWSIYDYLAYGIFVGWSVHGRFSCPVCMDNSDAIRL
jgi:hypothetical protein